MKKFVVTAVAAVSALAFALGPGGGTPCHPDPPVSGRWLARLERQRRRQPARREHEGASAARRRPEHGRLRRRLLHALDSHRQGRRGDNEPLVRVQGDELRRRGCPRISVEFQNGDIAYLSAFYCNHSIGDDWGRADFTRFKNDCSIFVGCDGRPVRGRRHAGRRGTSTPTPTPIRWWSRRTSSVTRPGRTRIDRLSLGAEVMYTNGNKVGTLCPTEASC